MTQTTTTAPARLYPQYEDGNLTHYVTGDRRFRVEKFEREWIVTDEERYEVHSGHLGRWYLAHPEYREEHKADAADLIVRLVSGDRRVSGETDPASALLAHAADFTRQPVVRVEAGARARYIEEEARRMAAATPEGMAQMQERLRAVLALRADD